jgi:hypothetical protein
MPIVLPTMSRKLGTEKQLSIVGGRQGKQKALSRGSPPLSRLLLPTIIALLSFIVGRPYPKKLHLDVFRTFNRRAAIGHGGCRDTEKNDFGRAENLDEVSRGAMVKLS